MENENKEIITDMTENKTSPQRRREIIKTLLIVFLAAMLVLTFFSNTIMNRSLPEISTESAVSGKLTERIRGSGIVEADQTYEVTADENRTIKSIEIKTGQTVKKGDVLFKVSAADDETLELEEKALADMELEYRKSLLTEPVDYTEEDQAIRNAREDLNRAIAERNAAAAGENYAASARDSYNADRRELASKTDVQSKLRSVISAIDNDDYSDASPEYSGDLPSLCSRWLKAESEYSAAEEKYLSRPEEERADQTSELNNKKSAKDNAASEYENEKNRVRSSLVSQLSSVEAEISDISFRISDYESQAGSESNMSYEAADADVTAKQRALEELMTAYNKTKKTNDITDQKAALDMEAQQKALDKQREKVEKLKKNLCRKVSIKTVFAVKQYSTNQKHIKPLFQSG